MNVASWSEHFTDDESERSGTMEITKDELLRCKRVTVAWRKYSRSPLAASRHRWSWNCARTC